MPHPGDVLLVKNLSDQTLKLQWDGRPVTVAPGKTGYASYEHVAHEYGAPAAGDKLQLVQDPFGGKYYIPPRVEERLRIQHRHGWILDDNVNPLMTEHARPNFEVYDQTGERVWTVAEDPTGEHTRPADTSPPNIGDQLARLKQQVALMENQLKEGATVDEAPELGGPKVKAGAVGPKITGTVGSDELEDLDVPTDDG